MSYTDADIEKMLARGNVKVASNSVHRDALLSCSKPVTPPAPVKRSKYGNQKVTIDGIKFDSKREGERYRQLKMLEAAGKITDLELQPVFELAPAVIINGKKKPALRYIGDFSYCDWREKFSDGQLIVEDAKGMLTDVYKIKRHLMAAVHHIFIVEV